MPFSTCRGLSSALNAITHAPGLTVRKEENAIPRGGSRARRLRTPGFDPLYAPNEGRFCAFVPAAQAGRAVEVLRAHPVSAAAAVAGHVEAEPRGEVILRSRIGGHRVLDMLSGEQLPRIC